MRTDQILLGIFHPKMKIMSYFTHTYGTENVKCGKITIHLSAVFVYTMKVTRNLTA